MPKKLKSILLLLIIVFLPGFGLKCESQEVKKAMKPITLTYWRVWDGPDAFADIIAEYKKIHPNINIEYKKLRYEEYEKELLDAWAEDRGPDMFSIHNTWVKRYQNKIEPMPAQITMAYPIVQGTMKKEVIAEVRTVNSPNLKEIKDSFVDAVYNDIVIKVADDATKEIKERVFGFPLAVDTLAMYYNKDLFNNAGITEPPEYWNREFQQNVKKLTRQNTKGQIIQSGAALGGSKNIERFSDILSALMMQNGSVMMSDGGYVMFHQIPPAFSGQTYNPGLEALRFYCDFANPAKEVYSWNSGMDDSLEMFAQGKLAIMFAYAYHLPQIRAIAPKLNFSVAKLPQIEGDQQKINFANYWVETVSKKSEYSSEAWDFLQFISKAEQVKSYLDKTKKPTALRSLIDEQIHDEDIGVFAGQILTAKSWYRGADSSAAELIMGEMIDNVVGGQDIIEDIIITGARQVQQTIQK
ncbi:extracellular solute-binding protein [Patescibacteria group bacterium]|nr:extracellular solute-binding protein [Candidatus Falkowbacteria bacterium]MBU3906061.1 extracellular solute-binding protein [Patescibacteria group bacterium]MBU4015162.1 extracellular solute-binding protein [Patescibacteria group bacterium]MBU4025927.1 extracellular solute-binding protein [Patescibacteria group bacterium]MBU4073109.1 extracellular solute-binding protein [Patescibacteria group bacterium]